MDSELSGSSQQDWSSSDETESRQQRESESSGENRPLPPGAVYHDHDHKAWSSLAAYAQEGLYQLVSLKWLTWEPVSRLSSHLTWRAHQLFRP